MGALERRTTASVALSVCVLLVAGCGSQAAPAAPRGRTSTSRAQIRSTPSPTRSTPTPSIPYDEATSGLVGAINSAGEARYSSTFGMVRLNHSQHGMSVEMTDLARGRTGRWSHRPARATRNGRAFP